MIYSVYPSKDVVKNIKGVYRSTGKSLSDKSKIEQILKNMSVEYFQSMILRYKKECQASGTPLKNFKTFLNNLPDYDEEIKKDNEEKENFVYFKWHNDGSDIKPRKIEKEKAEAYFANQLLGGYKAIIRKS